VIISGCGRTVAEGDARADQVGADDVRPSAAGLPESLAELLAGKTAPARKSSGGRGRDMH
jgi:hypothetical protein